LRTIGVFIHQRDRRRPKRNATPARLLAHRSKDPAFAYSSRFAHHLAPATVQNRQINPLVKPAHEYFHLIENAMELFFRIPPGNSCAAWPVVTKG